MNILSPMLVLRQSFSGSLRRNAAAFGSTQAFASIAPPTAESATALSHKFWLDPSTGVYKNYLKGEFIAASSPSSFHIVINPATNEEIGKTPDTSDADFEMTMQIAQSAFEEWKVIPIQQRQRVMLELQRLIRDHVNELAGLITLENGKTIADAKGDVFRGLEMVESTCQIAPYLMGDSMAGISTSMDCVSYREPLGVCAGIGKLGVSGSDVLLCL